MATNPIEFLPASQEELGLRASLFDDVEAVWLAYVALGGTADLVSFDAYLNGGLVMPRYELLVLDQTVWELQTARG